MILTRSGKNLWLIMGIMAFLSMMGYLVITTDDNNDKLIAVLTKETSLSESSANRSLNDNFKAREGDSYKNFDNALLKLKQEVDLLKSELEQYRIELNKQKQEVFNFKSLANVPLSNSGDAKSVKAQLENMRAQQSLDIEKQNDKMQEAFWQEPVDPGWSKETRVFLSEALHNYGINEDSLVGIECREKTCRVELNYPADTTETNIAQLGLSTGQKLPNIRASHYSENDGSSTVLLFLSKAS